MEVLKNILENTNIPILHAFILGLMTAISPCPLTTNITAIAFIGKDISQRRRIFFNGLIYTLGRAVSYSAIGFMLYFGASKFRIGILLQTNGEKLLGPILLIVGIVMLGVFNFNLPGIGKISNKIQNKIKIDSYLGALLLGVFFALAFCPVSGVFYFGMLIPLTITSPEGLLLPVVFAIATGLPVIIIAWLIAFSVSGVGTFYNRIKVFEFWFRKIVAVVFIVAGSIFIYIYFF